MFGSYREVIFKKQVDNGLVNRVEIAVRHGYGFTQSGRGTIKTTREYMVFIGCDPVFGCTQYGDLTRYFTSKAKALKYAKQTCPTESDNQDPVLIIHGATAKDLNSIGIHLKDATQWDFQDALEVAERDLFPAVYIHSVAKNLLDDNSGNVKPALALVKDYLAEKSSRRNDELKGEKTNRGES